MKQTLQNWIFATGDTPDCLQHGRAVTVPHTWNIEDGLEEYTGLAWYACTLDVPESWRKGRVRVRFGSAFHSAVVYLNGREVGRHSNAGYTPFTVELTPWLQFGAENRLTVRVDNRFSAETLPYQRSYDWANDGGLIRPVELLVTGRACLQEIAVQAEPILCGSGRCDAGAAAFGFTAGVSAAPGGGALRLCWALCPAGSDQALASGTLEAADPPQEPRFEQAAEMLPQVRYWHFDHPDLYTLRLRLTDGEETLDESTVRIGFRQMRTQGQTLYLNGEAVRLCGTEWMPGGDPQYGMAEPLPQLHKMLKLLKETNCVLTRFHWQQDDAVLDWCDENGILVQEEVPFWGKDPEVPAGAQWKAASSQLREMIAAHRNHPCIIAWGVGNELDAQRPQTKRYIRRAVALAHELDGSRFADYVSNTWWRDGLNDAVADGDLLMLNEYTGTWFPDREVHEELDKFVAANPGRAVLPSEFGLCEPAFSGGDARREEIFREKMAAYRQYPAIAGTINFCLNDYRTHIGEDGRGKYKRRVHGSTEMDGTPKPSYWAVQRECAPFALQWDGTAGALRCRSDLPCYEMRGYTLQLQDAQGQPLETLRIPDLRPGDSWRFEAGRAARVTVLRPNGWTAGSYAVQENG